MEISLLLAQYSVWHWVFLASVATCVLMLYITFSYSLGCIMKKRQMGYRMWAYIPFVRWLQVLRTGDTVLEEYAANKRFCKNFFFYFFCSGVSLVAKYFLNTLLEPFWTEALFYFCILLFFCAWIQILKALYYIYQRYSPEKARRFLLFTFLIPPLSSFFLIYTNHKITSFYT